jgi:hypothetical protein
MTTNPAASDPETLAALVVAGVSGGPGANGSSPEAPHSNWPMLDPAARYGLAGEIVAALEEHSESDPAALLLTTLAYAGFLIGPDPHAVADGADHPARIWPLIVGDTAKARKGSSHQNVRRVFVKADPRVVTERSMSGFGSGESLVDAVAGEESERRLMIIESEFTRVLATCKRDGSTLGSLLRQAWDGGRLEVRSRGGKAVADGAHVTVVAHITGEEFRARLNESDVHGGTVNRFLLVAARRSQLLPSGGNLDDATVAELAGKIATMAEKARKAGIVRRTPEAEECWQELYERLAKDEPGGLLGAAIARDAAQCLRLSVAYALLDGVRQVDVRHVEAAAAVWRYSRASAAMIFGERTGNPLADRILDAVNNAGTAGTTRTAVRDLLGRNVKTERIEQAIDLLLDRRLISESKEATGGRPRDVLRPLAASRTSVVSVVSVVQSSGVSPNGAKDGTTKTTKLLSRGTDSSSSGTYDKNDISDQSGPCPDDAPPPGDVDDHGDHSDPDESKKALPPGHGSPFEAAR